MQVLLERVLPADTRSVAVARRLVREALSSSAFAARADDAGSAVSELATNAVVHVGAAFTLRVISSPAGVRIELHDPGPQVPSARAFADTAGTGRGLRIVEQSVDRWGVDLTPSGKTVWFEFGDPQDMASGTVTPTGGDATDAAATVEITLLDVPLLMHMAWQEHAQALLREYLLHRIADDEHVLAQHAAASEVLAVLYDQVPQPTLPEDPDALLADTLEPEVTAAELTLILPAALIDKFSTLSLLVGRAVEAARDGQFLGPPTQPEIEEMREWLCHEVMRQASGHGGPRPWRTRSDVREPVADPLELQRRYDGLLPEADHVIVTDEASVIVAVSPSVAAFLGYTGPEDLLGRRVIVVVPRRYHQAHIAGTTLHATHGRDNLLGVRLSVPMVRADGTEVPVALHVVPRQVGHTRVFVADMVLPVVDPAEQPSPRRSAGSALEVLGGEPGRG